MDQAEIRLRLIEAAARNPDPRHAGGFVAGVLAAAKEWEEYVNFQAAGKGTLGLPKKA